MGGAFFLKGFQMAFCWEKRGCDEEMLSRCPHNVPGERCPADCHFAACDRPTHHVSMDPALIFRVDLNRDNCMKDICQFCEFFLTNGPVIEELAEAEAQFEADTASAAD